MHVFEITVVQTSASSVCEPSSPPTADSLGSDTASIAMPRAAERACVSAATLCNAAAICSAMERPDVTIVVAAKTLPTLSFSRMCWVPTLVTLRKFARPALYLD